jgi:predicted acylesterase/phospholipase RssA
MPLLFPAVEVERPRAAADWHVDGGVRLNSPIKPALAMGAERVLVVAAAPTEISGAIFIEGSIRIGRRGAERSLGPGRAPVWHRPGIAEPPPGAEPLPL